jgi:hypothetical protein
MAKKNNTVLYIGGAVVLGAVGWYLYKSQQAATAGQKTQTAGQLTYRAPIRPAGRGGYGSGPKVQAQDFPQHAPVYGRRDPVTGQVQLVNLVPTHGVLLMPQEGYGGGQPVGTTHYLTPQRAYTGYGPGSGIGQIVGEPMTTGYGSGSGIGQIVG